MPAMPIAEIRRADRRRDQADEQRNQNRNRDLRSRVQRERLQRHDDQQKHQRQHGQEDVQRDFVRRLLTFSALDQCDHAIQELWPGSDVTRTLIQSEMTRVPPVTADRSPPDSRMTGADSPVIADSSTDATPSMISPSAGMNSPALDHHHVVLAEARRRHFLHGRRSSGDSPRSRSASSAACRPAPSAAFRHRLGEVGEENREP